MNWSKPERSQLGTCRQDSDRHGRRFGEGIARRFAAEGAKVALLDIRVDAANRMAEEIGGRAMAVLADVTDKWTSIAPSPP